MGRVRVRLQPRARRDELVGTREGVLVVRVAAPPVDGRANDALCRLLAAELGVPVRDVTVAHGRTARDKVVEVARIETPLLLRRLRIAG